MFRRGLALAAVLGFASVVNAGAIVTLTPSNPGPYNGGETFDVAVSLTQDPAGSDIYLRGQRYDFNASSPQILKNSFSFFFDPAEGGGQQICGLIPGLCGTGHAQFTSLVDADAAIVNIVFTGAALDPFNQVKLPASAPVKVGVINITLPNTPGEYLLDAMNAAIADGQNVGAGIDFDFANRVTWVPGNGLSGGQVRFVVVPEPATLMLLGLGGVAAVLRRRSA